MKKIICIAFCWPLFQAYSPVHAQTKTENKTQEIIIMKNGDKDKKVTIETKNGETLINGKPASEYKDDDISVIAGKNGNSFSFSNNGKMNFFNNGEKKAFLGVTTSKEDDGVKITNVEKGSAAEKAGLQEEDIITKVGNIKISDPDDLMNAITSYKPKDEVKINYKRNGKNDDVKATLGEHSAMQAFSFNNFNMPPMPPSLKNFKFQMPPMPAMPNQPFANFYRYGNKHIGVKIEDTDNDAGAKITNVESGSAAETAGLKKDDIITNVNGTAVKNVTEVLAQIRSNNDKSSYTLKAKRNGADMNFEIKIPKKKNNADL